MITVDYLIPADAATAAEGKHYIHGAGWDTINALTFPAAHPVLAIAILLRVPWNDTNQPHALELDIENADGASILPDPPGTLRGPITVGRPPQAVPGEDQLIPLVFNLAGVQFPDEGTYACILRVEGIEAKRFPFRLRSVPAQRGNFGQ
jgi:hypothetical protein